MINMVDYNCFDRYKLCTCLLTCGLHELVGFEIRRRDALATT